MVTCIRFHKMKGAQRSCCLKYETKLFTIQSSFSINTRVYGHLRWSFLSPFGYGKLLELVSNPINLELKLCSEGHFSSIVFGRTLFEYCVWKDTFHFVRKDTYMTLCSEGHIDIIYFYEKKKLAPMFLQLALFPPLDHKEAIGTLGYPIASKLED